MSNIFSNKIRCIYCHKYTKQSDILQSSKICDNCIDKSYDNDLSVLLDITDSENYNISNNTKHTFSIDKFKKRSCYNIFTNMFCIKNKS